jgi:hypothetical protein
MDTPPVRHTAHAFHVPLMSNINPAHSLLAKATNEALPVCTRPPPALPQLTRFAAGPCPIVVAKLPALDCSRRLALSLASMRPLPAYSRSLEEGRLRRTRFSEGGRRNSKTDSQSPVRRRIDNGIGVSSLCATYETPAD